MEEDELGDDSPGAEDSAWVEALSRTPPRWVRAVLWLTAWLESLMAGVIVLLQWGVWLILTSQVARPYGIAVGIVIIAVQIVLVFGTAGDQGARERAETG